MNHVEMIKRALIQDIEVTQKRVAEINIHDELTIHEMADLERYASTINHFIQAYSALADKG